MLSKSSIRKKTNAITYSKGQDIYNFNKVEKFSVEEEEEEKYDYLTAKVKGSGRNSYDVSITYNSEEEYIEEISCDCPAFHSYTGICKHCVAVLLEYIDYVERQDSILEILLQKEESLAKLKTMKGAAGIRGPQKKVSTLTTPSMKELLTKRVMKRTLPMIQDSVHGKVRMEPYVNENSSGVHVEFKIGTTSMYVLKDVLAFDKALEAGENISYGQKLKFTHTLEAFESESRPLVKFIRSWVKRNKHRYMQTSYYGYYSSYSTTKVRSLTLAFDDLSAFIDAIGNRPVKANFRG